jgi:predicted ribosome-associated RNA-binding protein Tma20
MRRILGKTLGSAIAMLCLVSSLATATEMTCAKDDGKGTCIAATDPDGKTVVVVGEGLKTGEQMACEDRGNMIACQPLVMASAPLVPFEMSCAKDDGKGTCIAATDANSQTVVVVGEGVKAGEQMSCVDRGHMIACQAL